ncbi:MAG: type III pantothenate kinase [Coriobacteriales bacterium]|jgi:type III pantothenate kinase|nr:type III pantothenate kinase [Coriobacteriales bacterium]
MLLAVDVGNTQTVLGLYDQDTLAATWRVGTVAAETADELTVRLDSLLALKGFNFTDIDNLAISSVVPPLTEQWLKAATGITGQPPLILSSDTDTGLEFVYPNPAEVGADRIADAVAAIALYGAPVIVVDFGTATNIEIIDRDGAFVGGVIAPGLVTSANALFDAAARLARIDIEVPATVIGRSTKEAVQSGLTYGEIERIDGLVRRICQQLGYPATVVATGGLSHNVADLSSTITVLNDNLTLEGLRLIYWRNTASPRESTGSGG